MPLLQRLLCTDIAPCVDLGPLKRTHGPIPQSFVSLAKTSCEGLRSIQYVLEPSRRRRLVVGAVSGLGRT